MPCILSTDYKKTRFSYFVFLQVLALLMLRGLNSFVGDANAEGKEEDSSGHVNTVSQKPRCSDYGCDVPPPFFLLPKTLGSHTEALNKCVFQWLLRVILY